MWLRPCSTHLLHFSFLVCCPVHLPHAAPSSGCDTRGSLSLVISCLTASGSDTLSSSCLVATPLRMGGLSEPCFQNGESSFIHQVIVDHRLTSVLGVSRCWLGLAPCSSKSRHVFAQEQSHKYHDDPPRGLIQLAQRVRKRLHTRDCV